MNPEILQQLILAVALAIVSLLAFAFRSLFSLGIVYLRSKIGESNFQRVRAYADVVVKMLEQSPAFETFDGAKKKELAILAVLQFSEKNNLPIDRELVDKFIEAAVQEMNSQIGKIEWDLIAADGGALTGGGASYGSDN